MYESLYGFENVNAMTLEVIIDVLKRASAALPGGMVEAIAFASEENVKVSRGTPQCPSVWSDSPYSACLNSTGHLVRTSARHGREASVCWVIRRTSRDAEPAFDSGLNSDLKGTFSINQRKRQPRTN